MTHQEAWEKIAAFCPTIRDIVMDPSVSEIECNPDGKVFIEREGITYMLDVTMPEQERENVAERIARSYDKDISASSAIYNGVLPNGFRIAATCPPVSSGWCFSIRKFRPEPFTMEELLKRGTLNLATFSELTRLVESGRTLLIGGGTSSGKTSIINTLCGLMPKGDRIVLIEDVSELRVDMNNLVRFEAQPAQVERAAVTIADLVKHALRFKPDRIIVGEVRGPEAYDLLQALNTGHDGSMSTIHANNASASMSRLVTLAAMATNIKEQTLSRMAADAIDAVVQVRRAKDGRRVVEEILSVDGYNRDNDAFIFTQLASN